MHVKVDRALAPVSWRKANWAIEWVTISKQKITGVDEHGPIYFGEVESSEVPESEAVLALEDRAHWARGNACLFTIVPVLGWNILG